jgi:hypothetical protein
VRPVREQLEHDRLIRLLQTKFKRKFETGMNPGNEQNAAVGIGPAALYPDLVLLSLDRGRRLQVVVEVETGESVNHLEALAQWAHFSKVRAAFHLYVPASMVDVARRLCSDSQIHADEIWSYHIVGDEPRFTLVHRSKEAAAKSRPAPRPATPSAGPAKPARAVKPAPAVKQVRAVKPARAVTPAKSAKPKKSAKPAKPARRAKPVKKKRR